MYRQVKMMFCRSMLIIVIAAANLSQTTRFPKFQYKWSEYNVGLLGKKEIWSDLKKICESSGGYLASFTTVDEVVAVLDYIKNRTNYPDGKYEIGLSRQAGLPRNVDANWKWETGEEFRSSIQWAVLEPTLSRSKKCGARIDISTGLLFDIPATDINPNVQSKGYICEYDSLYFQSVKNRGVTRDASYMRCALRCLRQTECQGFHVNDAGCQIEKEINDDSKRHYAKIVYSN
ncbi:uncharacterized protein LOC117107699 [Anneissia japonica]|uniref:uncharacterized protein LOC117107699 n=1 Tax=Anneissia japonica TaxID=1529436 RepID=UPI001425B6ED|nr:uncharacterized protein LOC117107699 [Anneissia japonica]